MPRFGVGLVASVMVGLACGIFGVRQIFYEPAGGTEVLSHHPNTATNSVIDENGSGRFSAEPFAERLRGIPIEKRSEAIRGLIGELKKSAPSEFAILASSLKFDELRTETQIECLVALLEFAPLSIEPWISGVDKRTRTDLMNKAFGKVIANSMNAGVYLRCVEPGDYINHNADKALARLAQSDSAEALRLAKQAPADIRSALLLEVSLVAIQGNSEPDAESLADTVRELSPEIQGSAAAQLAAMATSDISDALTVLAKLPDDLRQGATLELLKREDFAVKQRRAAISDWIKAGHSVDGLKASLGEIIRQTSYESVPEAIDFVSLVPDEKFRAQLKLGLIRDVARHDPAALNASADERDIIQSEIALNSADNANAALDAASAISSPERRQQVIGALSEQWKQVVPNEFERLLNSRNKSNP